MSGPILDIETPEVFEPLCQPSPYKGAWGGRGSGKSYFFADKLIEDAVYQKGLLSVCIREIQKDLKDSAKRLIESRLTHYGLGEADGFKIFKTEIQTPGDGIIIFHGMQDHTAESIKSLEGFHRAWVEEAHTLSATSLQILRPTIRVKDSELWFSWNPRRKSDPVDMMLRGPEPPTGAIVVQANWNTNKFLTDRLNQERLDCLRATPEQYDHIWEGGYATVLSGAYFAKGLAEAKAKGRIGKVAADPLMQLRAYWDIGGTGDEADACAIWICQFVNREIRVLDYYETIGQELSYHLNWLRNNGYESALCVLPHDGGNSNQIVKITYDGAIRSAGFKTKTIPNQGAGSALKRIETVRRLFGSIWFNEATTEPGRDALGWYHEKKDEKRNVGLGPDHDWSSHGADAFGLMCIDYEAPKGPEQRRSATRSDHSFMGV